ncbi:glutathione S-transferase [Aureimonas sp. Leaf454]|uniref:glutathione S-transferase family protein n=1 Tax=Aureimonas sp. Leaf454 TaxID=1736381 RepID=UPI0006FEDFA8|nr:glutathione S-transferase family protein [Aureimonas sp. Leaf454]KQT50776.1 glutathione S-transferase [Aureimonas sp. Leaf454]
MRLFYASASPFASKVRMAAHHCDIELEPVSTDTGAEPADLLEANPLGKIPALVLPDASALYDSAVICDWLDRQSGHALVPQDEAGWLLCKRIEATADGVVDGAILSVYEVRFRPEDKRHQPWVDKQMRKAWRGMDVLEGAIGSLGTQPTTAHFAVAGLLGWFDLRFKGQWEERYPGLKAWIDGFPAIFPAYEDLKPKA